MAGPAKYPLIRNAKNNHSIFPKKSLLLSSDDYDKMAEESSKARLIQQLVKPDESISYKQYLTKFPHLKDSQKPEVTLRNQCIATYPSRVGLRWNPCVEVSSGEEIRVDWSRRQDRPSCNCENCTSKRCPSKMSSCCIRPRFKDNIMTFRDKWTMTPRMNHAGCSARTPIASPRTSRLSLTASNSHTRVHSPHNCPHNPKPSCRPSPRPEYCNPRPYREAERDTDTNVDYPAFRQTFYRQRPLKNCGTQYKTESGKTNLYNEGICDRAVPRCRAPSTCPLNARHGRMFCLNKCPYCCCRGPSAVSYSESKYHQRCKVAEHHRPVHYDTSSEDIRHADTIPSFVTYRYVSARPSITLPRKVLTSERHVEAYIQDGPCRRDKWKKK